MNRIKLVATGLVAALLTAACGGGGDSEGGKATVDVGYVPLPIFAPLFVADSKGYFKDEGLDVNLEVVKSGQDSIPLAASGKLDVAMAGFSAGMFNSINSGLDVRVVGSMGVADGATKNPPSALVVSKKLFDSGDVTSVADLKGRKLGALGGEGATSAFYVGMALKEAGLSIKDVSFTNLGSPDIPTAIKNGSIDGGFVSAPFWNMAVDDGTATKIWTTPKGTSGTGILYGGEFVDSPDAQKFFNAVSRAAQDLQGKDRYSDEHLKAIGEATEQTPEEVKSVPLYTWHPDLRPMPEQLTQMEQMWMDLGAIDYSEPQSPDAYVDTTFSEKVTTD